MTKSRRVLRYARYRVTGWFLSCFSTANIIYLLVLIGMFILVVLLQKFEDPRSINFFSSGALPGEVNRRELVVTTARIAAQVLRTTKCQHLDQTKKVSNAAFQGHNTSTKNNLPAMKVIYTPKVPLPFRRKVVETHQNTPPKAAIGDESLEKNTELIPDIYRVGAKLKSVRQNFSSERSMAYPEPDHWLRVKSDKDKVLVFSAYWDERFGNPTVRIMAITRTKQRPTLYCRFKMADGRYVNVTSTMKIMNEHWRLKYASYFVSCEIRRTWRLPTHVLVSTSPLHADEVTLPIHRNKNDTVSPRGNIAVCVKPLHYNYDRATWLLEFLEFHRLLGVDHFIFYNHTVGENVEQVLRRYIAMGAVTVLPWHIGIRSQTEIRTEGIFSSLNDCLFRTMYLFKYVIMLDFDEYIVPRDQDTYPDMIEQLENDYKKIRGRPGSFVFRNVFFYLYWENDTTVFGVQPEKPPDYLPYLVTQYKTRRLTSSMKPGSRSKYIVIPERAVEVGNHVVWRHTSGSRAINVPDSRALLHHYRICEFGGFACLKKKSLVDHVALRFGPELLDRVREQCLVTFRPDGRCPLSPPLGSPW